MYERYKKCTVTVENVSQGYTFQAKYDLSERQVEMVLAGGLLNLAKRSYQTK